MKMNSAQQLKAKIKNLAREKGVDPHVLFRIYMMERFLERVAHSSYRDRFILKGGMLISYLVGVDLRTTMDIDTTMVNMSLTDQGVRKFVANVIAQDIGDGVVFKLIGLEKIMEEMDYPGIRVTLEAVFDGTRTAVKLDISTGHAITPCAIETSLPLMFADPILLPAYPVVTILAEKLQTILSREVFNTRMRDFYDLHALRIAQGDDFFEGIEVAKAFLATCKTRNTLYLLNNIREQYEKICSNSTLQSRWILYQEKAVFAIRISWSELMGDLSYFIGLIATYKA